MSKAKSAGYYYVQGCDKQDEVKAVTIAEAALRDAEVCLHGWTQRSSRLATARRGLAWARPEKIHVTALAAPSAS